jgi:DNA repair photolyase
MATRYGFNNPKDWTTERVRQHDLDKKIGNVGELVMFPSSHDITPTHLEESIQFLRKILEAGNDVLIVSKPHLECIERICNEFDQYKNKILFRFTIGSTNNKVLKFWEPNAPIFKERLAYLKHAHKNGFQTSISCEPMLDNHIERVVKRVDPYVTETIWIGKANRLLGVTGRSRLEFNGHLNPETTKKALQLIDWQSDQNIIKLYELLHDNPKIRWKESIKSVLRKHSLQA